MEAQLTIWKENKMLVDLEGHWPGSSYDRFASGTKLPRDSVQVIFSSSKAISSLVVGVQFPHCLAMLVDRGQLEFLEPVARYWPEFGQNGKTKLTPGKENITAMSTNSEACSNTQSFL